MSVPPPPLRLASQSGLTPVGFVDLEEGDFYSGNHSGMAPSRGGNRKSSKKANLPSDLEKKKKRSMYSNDNEVKSCFPPNQPGGGALTVSR